MLTRKIIKAWRVLAGKLTAFSSSVPRKVACVDCLKTRERQLCQAQITVLFPAPFPGEEEESIASICWVMFPCGRKLTCRKRMDPLQSVAMWYSKAQALQPQSTQRRMGAHCQGWAASWAHGWGCCIYCSHCLCHRLWLRNNTCQQLEPLHLQKRAPRRTGEFNVQQK